MGWAHADVEAVVDVGLTTTGGHVWEAARRLAEYLERSGGPHAQLDDAGRPPPLRPDGASGPHRPLRVLELGAGCGWLGLTVARNCAHVAEVCVTEREAGGGVAHLRRNLEHNVARLGPEAFARVSVAALDWADYAEDGDAAADHRVEALAEGQVRGGLFFGGGPSMAPPWDVVIGSDLVFNEACVALLPRVLRAALRAGAGYALYAHTRYRFEILDRDFLAALARAGLRWVEVDRPAGRPESPPAFSSVFEDEFVVLYKISLA